MTSPLKELDYLPIPIRGLLDQLVTSDIQYDKTELLQLSLHILHCITYITLHNNIITLYCITFISVDFCLFEGADYRICRVDQSWGTDTQIPLGRYILHSI